MGGRGFAGLRRIASSRDLVVAGLGLVPGGWLLKDVAGAAIGAVGNLAGSDRSLSQLRDELAGIYVHRTSGCLFIIDDVNRLPGTKSAKYFGLSNPSQIFPNIIYLLISTREIAERAFEDPSNGLGAKWHEKIVQAAFDLPPVEHIDVQQLFLEGLEQLAGAMELSRSDAVGKCVS